MSDTQVYTVWVESTTSYRYVVRATNEDEAERIVLEATTNGDDEFVRMEDMTHEEAKVCDRTQSFDTDQRVYADLPYIPLEEKDDGEGIAQRERNMADEAYIRDIRGFND